MDLTDFLLARIAEDEATARNASPAAWTYDPETFTVRNGQWEVASRRRSTHPGDPPSATTPILDVDGAHIARHDPARVLADCAAKRAIVDLAFHREAVVDGEWGCCHSADEIRRGLCPEQDPKHVSELRVLAAVYADHPDYRDEWRPAD